MPAELQSPDAPPAPKKQNVHWNIRLSQESKEILQLLKKYLRLTQDEQIQLLGQLVLYHDMLPSVPLTQLAHNQATGLLKPDPALPLESPAIAVQKRVRELRRFCPSKPDQKLNHLKLQRPLPLENHLAELKDLLTLLQQRVEELTKAIDARTEVQLLEHEINNDDSIDSQDNDPQTPALNP